MVMSTISICSLPNSAICSGVNVLPSPIPSEAGGGAGSPGGPGGPGGPAGPVAPSSPEQATSKKETSVNIAHLTEPPTVERINFP
jgi:hypothetical protein